MNRLRARLASEGGFTLIELLISLILMGTVMGAVTTSFASAFAGETRTLAEATNQEAARLALHRLRMDIHCASELTASPGVTAEGGYYIVLTELKDQANDPICKKIVLPPTSNWVSWCTIKITETRWRLYRDDVENCTDQNATFMVDYIVKPDIWTVPGCTPRWQKAVMVTLVTNSHPEGVNPEDSSWTF